MTSGIAPVLADERRSEPVIDVVELVYKGSTTEASKTRRTGPCIQSGSAVDDTVICSLLGGLTWFVCCNELRGNSASERLSHRRRLSH